MNNLINFENSNINYMVTDNGEVLFELYSTGQALGYTKTKTVKDKEYIEIRKDRIDTLVKNAEIEPFPHDGKQYLNEDMLYDLIFESKTEKAKAFRKWVKEVLTTIRTTGAYVSDNITDEQQDMLLKYAMPRYRKQTFLITNIEQLDTTYQECMNYFKRKPAAFKLKIQKEIIKTLEDRKLTAIESGSSALGLLISEQIEKIQKKLTITSNRSYGAKLRQKNKVINQLSNYIESIEPNTEEYITIDYHSFTENCIYGSTNPVTRKLVFSKAYNIWRSKFPKNQFPKEIDVDFTKPVSIWMYFDHLEKFDVTNMQKSFIDMLCHNYGVDDSNVNIMRCCTLNHVNTYEEGKIYYCIKN